MIFVTVGAQMPFDRLVRRVDAWAGRSGRSDVLAQVGASDYRAEHVRTVAMLPPEEMRATMAGASAVVAHAGIGTIVTALELGVPILVVPRREALGETRSDHQVATARKFSERGLVLAALEDAELEDGLARVESQRPATPIGPRASESLLERIREVALGQSGA